MNVWMLKVFLSSQDFALKYLYIFQHMMNMIIYVNKYNNIFIRALSNLCMFKKSIYTLNFHPVDWG